MKKMGKFTCKFEGCEKFPNYGYDGHFRHWCKEHKSDEMIYLAKKPGQKFKSDLCIIEGCKVKRSCGYPLKKAEYCATHKLDGMISLASLHRKPCQEPSCTIKTPKYGSPEDNLPLYCSKHKKEGMIDLRHATCLEDGCTTQPNFNHPGEPARYCKRHKKPGMIDVKNSTCEIDDCKTQPAYGIKGDVKPTRCLEHKTSEMIDIRNPFCKSCNLSQVKSKDSLCAYCDPESHTGQRTKEKALMNVLENYIKDHEFINNRTQSSIRACGDRSFRPDFLLKLDTHILMIECDEEYHRSYEVLCEISRLVSLGMSGEGIPVIVIRFNPDDFKIKGVKQNVPMKERYEKFIETVEKHLREMPTQLLTVEYMYYTDEREELLTNELASAMSNY